MKEIGIKYTCDWIKENPLDQSEIEDLNCFKLAIT